MDVYKHFAVCTGFPGGSAIKNQPANAGHAGSILGLGRSPEEAKGHPLQYSGLENSMDCIHGGHKESDMTERLSLSLLFSLNALSIEDFISFV